MLFEELALPVAEDGRIHPTFCQTVSASGRILTTAPDLQRTPVRTAESLEVRRAFVASEGHTLLSADWPQVEQRLLAHGERIAVNTPIQGSGADLMNVAILRATEGLAAAGLRAKLVLQVNDELILDVPTPQTAATAEVVVAAMEEAIPLRVPLKVDVGIGATWADAVNPVR